jgi:hypothetical protein
MVDPDTMETADGFNVPVKITEQNNNIVEDPPAFNDITIPYEDDRKIDNLADTYLDVETMDNVPVETEIPVGPNTIPYDSKKSTDIVEAGTDADISVKVIAEDTPEVVTEVDLTDLGLSQFQPVSYYIDDNGTQQFLNSDNTPFNEDTTITADVEPAYVPPTLEEERGAR